MLGWVVFMENKKKHRPAIMTIIERSFDVQVVIGYFSDI